MPRQVQPTTSKTGRQLLTAAQLGRACTRSCSAGDSQAQQGLPAPGQPGMSPLTRQVLPFMLAQLVRGTPQSQPAECSMERVWA